MLFTAARRLATAKYYSSSHLLHSPTLMFSFANTQEFYHGNEASVKCGITCDAFAHMQTFPDMQTSF